MLRSSAGQESATGEPKSCGNSLLGAWRINQGEDDDSAWKCWLCFCCGTFLTFEAVVINVFFSKKSKFVYILKAVAQY